MEAFDQLPVAAIVNSQYFCVHGGISSNVTSVQAINNFDRKKEIPSEECLFSDLLWADPADDDEIETDYVFNEGRKFSETFGKRPVNDFLQREGLKSIVRAHECKFEGYELHRWNGENKPPPVITVFSAPNYSATNNEGGVFVTGGSDGDFFVSFEETEKQPYVLPRVLDEGSSIYSNNPLCDAFNFFKSDLIGHAFDACFLLCNATLAIADPALQRKMTNLHSVMSNDDSYIEKLVEIIKRRDSF